MLFRKRPPRHCLILDDPRFQPHFSQRKKSSLKWVFLAVTLVLISIAAAELARAEEPVMRSVNDAKAGQIVFPLAEGGFQQAIHLKTQVSVDINGMVAKVNYRQRFKNSSNHWREAVYVFPLAENAAIHGMEMRIGDRLIRSQVKEKTEATNIYNQAKSQGKKTALIEQQRPNLFTQKVANIGPGEEIDVQLSYLQQVGYDAGQFRFYLPTTLTPRYMPGTPVTIDGPATPKNIELEQMLVSSPFGWARATDQVPDAHKISPFMRSHPVQGILNPVEIDIRLQAGLTLAEITSRNHAINQKKVQQRHQIHLSRGQETMDRDFWLEWRPTQSAQPQAAVFQETFQGEHYALLMLMPPQISQAEHHDLPRELIFIIDTSGSMGGESIRQAKASLLLALQRLDNQDRFNIIEFNSGYSKTFHSPMPATNRNLQIANHFVHQLHAGGGTNMAPALSEALQTEAPPNLLKQVVFITDGAVGNEDQLFKLIQTHLGDARLFTVGIGSAPNSHFMTRAAQFGRGTFEYISNPGEVSERMSNLFRKLESPVLSNLSIQFPTHLENKLEQYPQRVPDLYSGEPLLLNIKALESASLQGEVSISGTVAAEKNSTDDHQTTKKKWVRKVQLDAGESHQNAETGISTLWARKKIAALMDEKILGRPEPQVKSDVLNVALPHKLVTQYSSLVAVEEQISRDNGIPLKPGAVPNVVAKGQLPQAQTYPRTATWLPLNLWLGNLCLFLLFILYRKKLPGFNQWPRRS